MIKLKFAITSPLVGIFSLYSYLTIRPECAPVEIKELRYYKNKYGLKDKYLQEFKKLCDIELPVHFSQGIFKSSKKSEIKKNLRIELLDIFAPKLIAFLEAHRLKYSIKEAKDLVSNLTRLWNKHKAKISEILSSSFNLATREVYYCIISPVVKDYGESLEDSIVLGAGWESKEMAFAVMLEELLHLVTPPKYVDKILSKIELREKELKEDIVVGYLLNGILKGINLDPIIRSKVVYKWLGRRREKYIRKLERKQSIGNNELSW